MAETTDASAAVPACLEELRTLKETITARMTGRQVQSANYRGRSLQYSETSVDDLIRYYNQLWQQCPAAQRELPRIEPLSRRMGARGGPYRPHFRGHV